MKLLLIALFIILLANAPAYVKMKCTETNWEWRYYRLPLYKAVISIITTLKPNNEIIVRPTRYKTCCANVERN